MTNHSSKEILSQRTYTRFCAIQALYQAHLENGPIETIIHQFERGDFSLSFPLESQKGLDKILFSRLVKGVSTERETLLGFIKPALKKDWTWERMDPVLLVMILCALFELIHDPQTPVAVIISEYLTLCRLFYGDQETAFIHGILDQLSKVIRSPNALV